MAGLSSLGAARTHIHPADVDGKYTRRAKWLGWLLMAVLLIVPWVRLGGVPIFLNDIESRQFFVFGQVFSPRDSVVLLSVILSAGLVLFMATSLFGRIWCGYGCPQTVLLEGLIRPIEKWIDGTRGARSRLQKAPWTATKIRKRLTKWFLFALVAVGLSMSFMGFFADAYELWTGRSSTFTYGFTFGLAAILFLDFAWFREQFCHYVCPYARLQGVLTDENTIQIGYDFRRGETRKPRGMKMSDVTPDIGECIDCRRCVTVCPSGIDIRDGFQLECIACARCVDACTDVLGKLGRETLVVYDSQANLEGRETHRPKWRMVIYGIGLAACAVTLITTLASRTNFDVTIAQTSGSVEQVLENGNVRNLFQMTIHNNSSRAQTFTFSSDLEGATLTVPGGTPQLAPAERRLIPVFVEVSLEDMPDRPITPFRIHIDTETSSGDFSATFRHNLH